MKDTKQVQTELGVSRPFLYFAHIFLGIGTIKIVNGRTKYLYTDQEIKELNKFSHKEA